MSEAPGGPSRSGGFRIQVEPGVVTVASEYRLQFDSKPQTQALKAAIGDAVAGHRRRRLGLRSLAARPTRG